ncbi:MAG: outer membrane beta-barrel protein [Bacteroidetes bacterium]|nr:outer membrane beta-barrel protein [Bacteroidota bacterium]
MRYFFVIILFFLAQHAKTQTWEIGLSAGAANYLGDLAPTIALNETKPFGGLFLKKNYSGYFSLAGTLSIAQISGNDQNFKSNELRNLSFRSNLIEAAFHYEFNFDKYVIGLRAKNFSPYVSVGLGFTYFIPQAELNGSWHNLRPLATEGQNINGNLYSPVILAMPMGGGIKWQIAERFNTTFHATYRLAFSDNIDDVSSTYFDNDALTAKNGEIAAQLADRSVLKNKAGYQRGNSKNHDWYMFTGITISYILADPNCPNPAGTRRR